jgi:hypothetical protein
LINQYRSRFIHFLSRDSVVHKVLGTRPVTNRKYDSVEPFVVIEPGLVGVSATEILGSRETAEFQRRIFFFILA